MTNLVKRRTIIFFEESLGQRGTTTALFDYAYYAREYLNLNVCIAYCPRQSSAEAIIRFQKEFPVVGVYDGEDLQKLVDNTQASWCYTIKFGIRDGWSVKNTRFLVHSVFCADWAHAHGDTYAVVSESQSLKAGTSSSMPWVPHMYNLPKTTKNLREDCGIPSNACVFGRHGGPDTFNVQFVKDAIPTILESDKDIWFIFLNTEKFIDHPRVIFLPATNDRLRVAEFINTCDAMIHARDYGETFGISVLEFACANKPVLTFVDEHCMKTHILGGTSHLDILEGQGIEFHNKEELLAGVAKCWSFKPKYRRLERFQPVEVMKRFESVFLK